MMMKRKQKHYKYKPLRNKKLIRHTHRTAAGLEDALAVALDLVREYEQSEVYAKARLQKLMEIIKQVRTGPHNYDPERPAGDRYEIIRRRLE